ncbi:MAG: hypothetical protein ACRDD1_18100 [Planctomycetia bacterium]
MDYNKAVADRLAIASANEFPGAIAHVLADDVVRLADAIPEDNRTELTRALRAGAAASGNNPARVVVQMAEQVRELLAIYRTTAGQ